MIDFPTKYNEIIKRIEHINPIKYGRTRNNLDGDVTHISPYLTHGVISLPLVCNIVLDKYTNKDCYTLIFELAWREFFQRVYSEESEKIFKDLKNIQTGVQEYGIPKSILDCSTSIQAIDKAYSELYQTGYMHNHARMWSAMLICNVSKYAWYPASKHMYYHLLDGDKASNTLSWQWVAGTFSSKEYLANQSMINKFARIKQSNTFLDVAEPSELSHLLPVQTKQSIPFDLKTDLSAIEEISKDTPTNALPIWLYSIWTLDPSWQPSKDTDINKVLFIDVDELAEFPMSQKRISFVIELSKNINDLEIVLGTQADLKKITSTIYRKDHPSLIGWPGHVSEPEYMFPDIINVPRGFMSYWKKCEQYL